MLAAFLADPDKFVDYAGQATEFAVREFARAGITLASAVGGGVARGLESSLGEALAAHGLDTPVFRYLGMAPGRAGRGGGAAGGRGVAGAADALAVPAAVADTWNEEGPESSRPWMRSPFPVRGGSRPMIGDLITIDRDGRADHGRQD